MPYKTKSQKNFRSDTLYRQIAGHYEREILSGHLTAGTKLPATLALAREFGVNADTIQQSLMLLSSQGLVERKPGRGTIVRAGCSCREIGVVCSREMMMRVDMAFHRFFLTMLLKQLEDNHWHPRLYLCSQNAGLDATYYQLRHAVEDGALRGIFEFCSNQTISDYVAQECPLPHCDCRMHFNYELFMSLALQHLRLYGAQNIAIFLHGDQFQNQSELAVAKFLAAPENHAVNTEFFIVQEELIPNGYRAATQHLLQGRFDAVLCGNDMLGWGLLAALAEHGTRIPQDLKFITYSNKNIPFNTGLKLTRVEFAPQEMVQDSFDTLTALIEGVPYQTKELCPILIPGQSCGE